MKLATLFSVHIVTYIEINTLLLLTPTALIQLMNGT